MATVLIDSDAPAYLSYNIIETNGQTNISFDQGTLAYWFNSDWVSVNQGGAGPGFMVAFHRGRFYSTNGLAGWWSLYPDPGGVPKFLYFQSSHRGRFHDYVFDRPDQYGPGTATINLSRSRIQARTPLCI